MKQLLAAKVGALVGLSLSFLVTRALTRPNEISLENVEACAASAEIEASASLEYDAQDRTRNGILSVSFSPDGKWLAASGYRLENNGGLSLWETKTQRFRNLYSSPAMTAVSFSPDGKKIAMALGLSLYLYDKETEQTRHIGTTKQQILSVSYAPNGKWIATGDRSGEVYAWDVKTRASKYLGKSAQGDTDTVVFSPDSRFVASGGDDVTLHLWDVETGKGRSVHTHPRNGELFAIAFSPNGELIVSGSTTDLDSPCLINLKTGDKHCSGRNRGALPYAASFSPDGKTFAVAWSDGAATLHNAKDARVVSTIQSKVALYSVAFSPNGKTLATAGNAGFVQFWDPKTAKEIKPSAFEVEP